MKKYNKQSKNKIWLNEKGLAIVELTQGQISIVDEKDIGLIASYKWYAQWNGYNWYAITKISENKKQFNMSMHRFLLKLTKYDTFEVDHINRWTLDNRRNNIRTCTPS